MEFKLNTEPLANALNLGVINANVSNMYKPSCVALVTAKRKYLTINLESNSIVSEITLPGMGSSEEEASIFVDCLLFKQLINTLDSNITDLIIEESGLTIKSGKSSFTLPKVLDEDIEMKHPSQVYDTDEKLELNVEDWKFVKENQLYAIAMSFSHPVYRYIFVSDDMDVLVGDFDLSIFTHSTKSNLGRRCLLTPTIVNLFTSIPEGCKFTRHGDNYILQVDTESYNYVAEISPTMESDDIGYYQPEIILNMMNHYERKELVFNTASTIKFLSQAQLLASSKLSTGSKDDAIITMIYEGDAVLHFIGDNVEFSVDLEEQFDVEPFKISFKLGLFYSVISKFSDMEVSMTPVVNEGVTVGITLWTDELSTSVAGVDE